MKKNSYWIFLLTVFLAACNLSTPEQPLHIAISKASPVEHYGNYTRWIKSADSTVVCLDMYHTTLDSALLLLDGCSGLLLSGGPDVFPGRYDLAQDSLRCGIIDYRRDTLEIALIKAALVKKIPILGICRGEQLLNVYFGGSLIVDIPEDYDSTVKHRCDDYLNCFHDVQVDESSLLYQVTGVSQGTVNTNHHQAAGQLAHVLKVSARASDGLIEAIEYHNPGEQAFLLGVQWHPERMDADNPLSMPIAMRFLEECRVYIDNKD